MCKNNQKKLVSVIICFFNANKFLKEAIESVFAQTYKNWELFLIDDGSTDGSIKIALEYAKQYPQKVTYLEHDNHKNLGLSASRNLGINKSHGEYIAFLDADDVWLPQKLKEQIEIMDAHPEVTMVYGPALYWFSWTEKPTGKDCVQNLDIEYDTMAKPPVPLRKLLQSYGAAPLPSCLLVRRKVINLRGGFEELFINVMEDQVFLIKIFATELVFVSKEIWYKYRRRADSMCYSMNDETWEHTLKHFWKWTKQYLTNKGVKDKKIWLIVDKQNKRYNSEILF
jgi:glycosyltransferase involved in cell wall biosynthesis